MRNCWALTSTARSALVVFVMATLPSVALPQAQAVYPHDSLGTVDFGVSCAERVRPEFNRAVALLHHMTYPVAHDAFQAVVAADPGCALGYWGMAMTLFQPLWPTRPDSAALDRGWKLMQTARRSVASTGRESLFVTAGEAFFDPADNPDYWTRIERWAAASTAVYSAYPDDVEAAAFFALAHLAAAARSDAPARHHARAAEVLRDILARVPSHPGAIHYTIHANDFAGREQESLDVVRNYGAIAPRNPHALHMPTHIFVRLGAWDEVIDWNRRAAEAALAQRVGPGGKYIWDEFPHAGEYLLYAYLQRGDDSAAAEVVQRLAGTPDLQPSFKTAFHLASTASRYALERRDWQGASQLPPRSPSFLEWDRFTWPEAVVWFARGLGAAHLGDTAAAAASIDRLTALGLRAAQAGEPMFASQIEILRLENEAWLSYVRGNAKYAVASMQHAVELETQTPKHPVTPAATLPARELLGDLYLALGRPELAREAYTESNSRTPGRLNTLAGLARASVALGDPSAAQMHYGKLLESVSPRSTRPAVLEARSYLAGVKSAP